MDSDSTASPVERSVVRHDRTSVIATRTDLIQALCDAAQLEHALCCAYLFAALSLKRRSDEGVPQARLADLRDWESALLLISRQEMIHLGIVCNLLTAVGGMPYLQKPNFPIKAHRYGELPELSLERFSKETIERLVLFETPEWEHLQSVILRKVRSAKDYDQALSIISQQICAETEWSAGDLWMCQGDTFVPVLLVSGELHISYDAEVGRDIWMRWQTSHPPQGQELAPAQTLDSAVANTYVEIPIYRGSQLLFVWRFFYETFRSFDEDDALAHAAEVLLSRPELTSLLDELASRPRPAAEPEIRANQLGIRLSEPELRYATIGGFYRQIRKGFLRMCYQNHQPTGDDLFTGFQTGNLRIGIPDRNIHDMDLPTVSDLDSALSAIEQIIETGEACFKKREDSHYVRLVELQKELEAVLAQPGSFEPARNIVPNPVTVSRDGCTLLEDPDAIAVAEIFDATYEISLQMVARFLAFPDDKVLKGMAFGPLMTMAIRPLAEILGELNANGDSGKKAGPPFQNAARDILHPHRLAAWAVFGERLHQIAVVCNQVQKNLRPEHAQAGERLSFIGKNINYISSRLKTAVTQAKTGAAPAFKAGS